MARLFINGVQIVSPVDYDEQFYKPSGLPSCCVECETMKLKDCPLNKGMGCTFLLREYGIILDEKKLSTYSKSKIGGCNNH